jgi:molybdenum transport protein
LIVNVLRPPPMTNGAAMIIQTSSAGVETLPIDRLAEPVGDFSPEGKGMHYITDEQLDQFLREDLPYGDLTTHALGLSSRPASITFKAGMAMVASSTEEAARIMTRLGCAVSHSIPSGSSVEPGGLLVSAHGPAAAVFGGWKVAQVLMEYASGIATAAARLVAAARSARPGVVVTCTRKNFPGVRAVTAKAIVSGGATPHRLGLSESILVFPQHRALMEEEPLDQTVRRLKAACPEKKVVIEVTSIEEAEAAAEAGVDVIQLEKFPPGAVATVAARLSSRGIVIAAAGGVNLANAAQYANAGAHVLVTSAPYSAPPLDVKVTIAPFAE